MTKIISVNAGSSSLKFKLFEMPTEDVLISGIAERIGLADGIFKIEINGEKKVINIPIPNHKVAVELLMKSLIENNIIKKFDEIEGVGHRVVQGGSHFDKTAVVTPEVEEIVESLCNLAPLHNPANLLCYREFKNVLPTALHTFVFDTAFHQTIEPETYLYPVPYEWYSEHKVRKYGAHGTSHQFVSKRVAEILNKPLEDVNTITCHLGNGASISAIKGGKSINTSMGFTPLGGVMMGTRCGDLDPSVVFYMQQKLGLTPQETDFILNKKSGMLGISGFSSDARDIQDKVDENDERAILTQKIYVNRAINIIGGYFVQLGRLDNIVFTAGIGENDATIRELILKSLEEALGLEIDYELNSKIRGKEIKISKENSKVAVYIIPTNEELVIAYDTYSLLKK